MDVRQSVLVLTKGVVPDIAIAVVIPGEVLVMMLVDVGTVVVTASVVSIGPVGALVVEFDECSGNEVVFNVAEMKLVVDRLDVVVVVVAVVVVVIVVSETSVDMARIVVTSAGNEPSCMVH